MEIYKSRGDAPIVDWQWFEPSLRNITHWILRLAPREGGKALDVGCGTGRVAFALAERGFDVVGVDAEPRALAIARRMAEGRRAAPRFELGDLTKPWTQGAGTYDFVVCSEVLEHVRDDRPIVENLYTALKPGGRLVVTVPYDPRKWSVLDEYGGHVRRYTKEEMRADLSGFEDVRMIVTGFPFYRLLVRAYLLKTRLLRQVHSNEALWESPQTRVVARILYPFVRADNVFAFTGLGDALIVSARKPREAVRAT